MTTEVFGTPGQNVWTCPPGVNTVQVELWGAGAGGGGNNTTSDGGGGGGSGGYARINAYAVTPGNVYTYNVGTAGPGGSGTTNGTGGGATWWISAATFQAPGGLGGHAAFAASGPLVGGAGGTSFVGSFDDTKNGLSGGAGLNGNTGQGGGGGGSSGNVTTGGAGTAAVAGVPGPGGTAGTDNGATGGAGSGPGASGNPGSAPGAGGGGTGDGGTLTGGAGGAGQVTLIHEVASDFVPNAKRKVIAAAILAAWAIAPILIWQNGLGIPETSEPPPINREWVKVVNRSWEPPDPPPTQGRRFFPHETPAVEQTPYSRSWLNPVAAWTPETWGAQSARHTPPPTPDDPPFSSRRPPQGWEADQWDAQRARYLPQVAAAAQVDQPSSRPWLNIVAQWTQDDWQAQTRPRTPQAAAAAVDEPPVGYRPWLKTTLASWEPAQIILWQNGILVPDGVDQIPTARNWLPTVLRAWEPPEYAPQGWKRVVPEVAAAVDAPPPRSRLYEAIRQAWADPEWAAQSARHVTEGGAAAEEKTPFKRAWLPIIEAWEQTLIPLWGAIGIQDADVPPPGRRLWLPSVIQSWEVTWSAQRARYVVQEGPVFDAPPTTERVWLAALAQWAPLDWAAQTTRHLVQPGVQVDEPPVTERTWLRAVEQWGAPTWEAQAAPHTPPPTPDAPPITERVWLEGVLRAWEPVPNEAQRRPLLTHFIPAAVNDPPFGLRAWLPTVHLTWEPPDPEPKQLARVVTESGPEPAPAPEVTPQTPAGKHKPRYYAIKVKGKDYVFGSVDALLAFLNRQEVAVEHRAKEKAEFDAKRILRVGAAAAAQPKPPRVAMRSAVPEIADYIALLQQRIDKLYRDALMSELMAQAQELEDIKEITRML